MKAWLENAKAGIMHHFRGGIHPNTYKASIDTQDIVCLNSGRYSVVPLQQHIGSPAKAIVCVGERVLIGQALSHSLLFQSPPVHAPCSGIVVAIENRPSTHASGLEVLSVVVENDEQYDEVQALPSLSLDSPIETIIERVHSCGISGMGGAGFPTAIKVNQSHDIDLLLINGAECEPYISADNSLMQNHALEIIRGVAILKYCSNASLALIAVEDDKPEAIAALRQAIKSTKNQTIDVRVVPTKYPSGGEKQLIQIITGLEITAGQPPISQGILVQNVGTAYAICQAVEDGRALTQRVLTLAGDYVEHPRNYWVPIGTPVDAILEQTHCPSPSKTLSRPIIGGAMMGFMLNDTQAPVTKTTNCILYNQAQITRKADACIRCGECAQVCPIGLLPQQLHWYSLSKDLDKAKEYNVMDCIECGACAFVCPSQIPLVEQYRETKASIRLQVQAKLEAERAKMRHENRLNRLEQEKSARKKQHQEAAQKRKQKAGSAEQDAVNAALSRVKSAQELSTKLDEAGIAIPDNSAAIEARRARKAARAKQASDKDTQATTNSAVAAAIARAKQKKATQETAQAVQQEEQTKTQNPAVAAAIARAKAKKQASSTLAEKDSPVEDETKKSSQNPAVAAAIARAKAKKQANSTLAEKDLPVEAETKKSSQNPAVAAAIARAKAKKQASSTLADNDLLAKEETNKSSQNPAVAAAIARAKAKKLEKESNND